MGCGKEVQPVFGKVGIWPALMVSPSTPSLAAATLAEDAAQAHAGPSIQAHESGTGAMLEIAEPTAEGLIDVRENRTQTRAVIPPRLGTDGVLELLETFGAGPMLTPFKMIPQKVKAARTRIHDAGFGRVQRQTGRGRPLLDQAPEPQKHEPLCRSFFTFGAWGTI